MRSHFASKQHAGLDPRQMNGREILGAAFAAALGKRADLPADLRIEMACVSRRT